jgi:hypothetical protein
MPPSARRSRLQPVGGQGTKIFLLTYPRNGGNNDPEKVSGQLRAKAPRSGITDQIAREETRFLGLEARQIVRCHNAYRCQLEQARLSVHASEGQRGSAAIC